MLMLDRSVNIFTRPHRCAEDRNAREAASCRQEQTPFGANDVPPLLGVDAVPSAVQPLCCEAR